jgi:transglutaminase-like putative cysteine protease
MKTQTSHDGKTIAFVYYLFAFLLLWEWLRPLQKFTDTSYTFVFVLFIGISFFLTFMKARWYVTFPVKIVAILLMLHGLYFDGVFFGFLWMKDLIQDITFNIGLIQSADWMSMTSSYRSLLLFILLWLLVYLIHYCILYQKRILFFFVLTLLYITVLDTFTPYDATLAIVRTVLIGFFMIGLLYFDRLKKVENLNMQRLTSFRWILPLFGFIMFSLFLAILAPKASPQWPDPVPFITAIGREGEGEGGMKKIGYSQNDEKLGGGFVADDTKVFTHVSADRHYWRVETKDVYTGKGWEVSDPEADLEEITNIKEELSWTDERVETKSLESSISINEGYRYLHVMYPLGLTEIQTEVDKRLYLNRNTELITPFRDNKGNREEFMAYEVRYELPSYPLNEMKKEQNDADTPDGFIERYTQLPDSLPNRVKELAVQITENESNQYDKAKAIENYLGSVEFSYETEDVPIPSGNQDYVDQFLFETLKGYCDNFSTSMIVLLRSVDIPARWVKGYTEGDFIKNISNDQKEYQVTNNNAHSWVEVYFAGVGWVPFEPTKGFINPYDVTNDYKNTGEQDQKNEQEENVEKEVEEEKTPEKQEQEEKETASTSANLGLNIFDIRFGSTLLYGSILFILVAVFTIYKTRMRWLPRVIIKKYKNRADEEVFFQAYESLLKQFERFGIKRKEGQTLRGYAHEIDDYFHSEHMTALTKSYERALYRRDNAKEEWIKSVELWENLIKRTSS